MAAIIKWLGLGLGIASLSVSAMTLEQQRETYEQAQLLITQHQIEQFTAVRKQLDDYPLTPYLDYRMFLLDIAHRTPKEVEQYIKQHHQYPFSQTIRGEYLDALVENQNWDGFYHFQTTKPRMQSYQCSFYFSKYKLGETQRAFQGANELWLNGSSIAKECDPLFEVWNKAGMRSDELVLQRMQLAFSARNGGLINYLKDLPKSDDASQNAMAIYQLYKSRSHLKNYAQSQAATEYNKKVSMSALRQLTYAEREPQLAINLLDPVAKAQKYTAQEKQQVADYIAYSLINTDDETLAKWRDDTLLHSHNKTWLERRARLAIQHQDWHGLAIWIERLPQKDRNSKRWQYWLARTELAQGEVEQGKARMQELLGHRNFYSIAAADYLNVPVQYQSSVIVDKAASITQFSSSLARIKELIAVDKISAAKHEWRWLLSRATHDQQRALAQYAAKKHWHHLTVIATIEAKMWDHLDLRFPLAHQWWFNFYAKKYDVNPVTLISLARQESGLDADAQSPVGARGLMQIMPKTASHTAKVYDLDYQGANDLFTVEKNIEVGSRYLSSLMEDYNGNRIFAFGAYNAGPNRISQWRERTGGKLDAYSFIEAIPFKETRGYIQNILMFEVYYRDILDKKGTFLSDLESEMKY
ncbi:murein transglycosylase [Vibrio gallicus]|uniref:murein transglycosylase n=1 Tax=Vibrio gallicus TaxID=190897 RepID=UPI0021C2F6D0|nr:murein transglycosylase [Vibrio gallicus]